MNADSKGVIRFAMTILVKRQWKKSSNLGLKVSIHLLRNKYCQKQLWVIRA